jgi:hypothetical protein
MNLQQLGRDLLENLVRAFLFLGFLVPSICAAQELN